MNQETTPLLPKKEPPFLLVEYEEDDSDLINPNNRVKHNPDNSRITMCFVSFLFGACTAAAIFVNEPGHLSNYVCYFTGGSAGIAIGVALEKLVTSTRNCFSKYCFQESSELSGNMASIPLETLSVKV